MTPATAAAAPVPLPAEGWLTDAQAARLAARAREVAAPGTIVEIGSFRGRSTVALARASVPGVEIVAIDPHAGSDRGPQEFAPDAVRGNADFNAFHENLQRAGVADRVRHVRRPSQDALAAVEGLVPLLYIDGAHRFGPARADLERWGARVPPGGVLLVHDAFSSVGVTLALLRSLLLAPGWRYAGRTGTMAEYHRVAPGAPGRARSGLRQLAALPWFARNLVLKVLILARVSRADWPY